MAAANHIRKGDADIIVAGGSEAPIIPVGLGGFVACRSAGFASHPVLTIPVMWLAAVLMLIALLSNSCSSMPVDAASVGSLTSESYHYCALLLAGLLTTQLTWLAAYLALVTMRTLTPSVRSAACRRSDSMNSHVLKLAICVHVTVEVVVVMLQIGSQARMLHIN